MARRTGHYNKKRKTSMRSKEVEEPTSKDWENVGRDYKQALVEVAGKLGGKEVVAEVVSLGGVPTQGLPDMKSADFLEQKFPGSINVVLARSVQIQQVRQKREKSDLFKSLFKRK